MSARVGSPIFALVFALALSSASLAGARDDSDPLEALNRPIFWFNEQVDRYALEPAARGWRWLVPEKAQQAFSRFFRNLDTPTLFVNNLLQGKPRQAAIDVTRFAFNSTFGLAGFFDPATAWGLPRADEDFGQTLGVWGVPPGPYLTLPFLGPASLRDGSARLIDRVTAVYPMFVGGEYTMSATAVDLINWRAQSIEQFANLRATSLDFYVAVRNGYLQRRQVLVQDGAQASEEDDDDLYLIDEDEE